jgi:ABC-type branched-subunit amino acid transport system substrate-binding protein
MNALRLTLLAFVVAIAGGFTSGGSREPTPGVTDTEIRIGNLMPYTGPLAAFAPIGKAASAYFDMINERGGVNGRKIKFISHDDNSDPSTALDLTRGLVERDDVLLLFASFGSPGNLAVRKFLNEQKIPQLFVVSGDEELSNPKSFPWTMGWQPSFREEGRIYANYIQSAYPGRKIVVLWQNDQFGRDLYKGFQEGLGDLNRLVLVDVAFEIADPSIDTHVSILKRAGADIFVFAGAPSVASQVIKIASGLDWHPVFILEGAAASIAGALRPAGVENSTGVISTSFLKDANDPAWKDDPAIKDWSAFMDKYLPGAEKDDSIAMFGYAAAETLVHVLKQCGDDLSRENVMRQASSLKAFQSPMMLPGITINTHDGDFRPIKNLRLVQFDGKSWLSIGDVLDTAFTDKKK